MSRSYKKTPVCKDQAARWTKRQASKAVRRHKGFMSSGKWYRKVYCSWNISDWRFYKPYCVEKQEWATVQTKRVSFDVMQKNWKKFYQRK
ncbi:hypothetical protein [Paenibacillus polysaccharolyticus]|uniref:hypothetical protein n=1 Tax=Paenibacillus polysaccharolyticus TaxID=582692 RepID=UPI00280A6478|nr:hypothetical protein [Paenibacillus polysaccharolyticus]